MKSIQGDGSSGEEEDEEKGEDFMDYNNTQASTVR